MDEARQLIEHNDQELDKREKLLMNKVNTAYDRAVVQAVESFRYLEKLNPKVKPSSKQVRKIVERVLKDFRDQFEELVDPFQSELVKQYDEGLREAGALLAIKDEKKKTGSL